MKGGNGVREANGITFRRATGVNPWVRDARVNLTRRREGAEDVREVLNSMRSLRPLWLKILRRILSAIQNGFRLRRSRSAGQRFLRLAYSEFSRSLPL